VFNVSLRPRQVNFCVLPLNDRMTQDDWTTFVNARPLGELGVSATPEWFLENEPKKWMQQIHCDPDTAVRIAIAVVDLVLPEWQENHPDDIRLAIIRALTTTALADR
jgi:hypothetical protein